MTLPELSIKRHVLAFMASGVLLLFGIISYQRIGMDRLPYIEYPVISVTTVLRGGNPEVIDAAMTNLIESAVNGVPGIEDIQSTSTAGVSRVNITFNLEKRIDVAFNEVQAKVNQVLRRLPKEADPPIVSKVQTNATPMFWIALSGDRTQQQLNQYAANTLKKKLETIDGVGEVRIGGQRDRTIRVNLHTARMAAYSVTVQDITEAFNREHLQLAGGFLTGHSTEQLVKLDLEFHRLDDLERMIVAYRDGAPVRLKDVASVEDGLADFRQLSRYKGETAVSLGIIKIPNTNTVQIAEEIQRRLTDEIIPELPPGLSVTVASNDAVIIREIINALKEHLLEGTLLAALVVLLFLRSLRSTLIIATAIPVSLLGAVAVMYFFGYTFNSVTMLALLLLIGVVVDDSIVVLENIFRHREHLDPDPISAAVNGSREVTFAVLAATLSLVCIFAPVVFMGGILGQFFKSFAVVVTFGVMVSWFVALTLTPMLCSRYLKVGQHHGPINRWLERRFNDLQRGYTWCLDKSLRFRWSVLAVALAVFLASFYFFRNVGKELAPQQDEGRFAVSFRAPLGSSITYSEQKMKEIEAIVSRYPEVDNTLGVIGFGGLGQVSNGVVVVRMKPRAERRRSQQEVLTSIRREVQQIAGARVFPRAFGVVPGERTEPLQFVVTGTNLREMGRHASQLQQVLQSDPEIGRLDTDLQLDLPQIVLTPDRTRAQALALTSQDLALAVSVLTGGVDVAQFSDEQSDGRRYFVRLKAADAEFLQQADMSKIYLRNRQGQLVRMDTVASFKEVLGPAVIGRFDLQYSARFFGIPSVSLGDAVEKVRATAQQLLPPGYEVQFLGEARELGKTQQYILFAFTVGVILLYMVLASQFNSFRQPLVIMLAVPLAVVGGIFALWLSGPWSQLLNSLGVTSFPQTLNIYSMIGLVLLIGLVAKNSILLVDLTNQRRTQGLDVESALRDACPIRLRPVLMTSLTIILALTPAALGLGAGAETNGPLALAVIGGMITSTLLTLVVVPAAYSLVESGDVLRPFRSRKPELAPEEAG
ncbi:MAG: acriflavin resistance protein [Betaproteobacteria bacterium RIFCSPLOWO2_12_FULL_66_14]|nr:MAG: acriflavin resistance protein [Betaproteobacteria bacterium RIFCSPLOWO2_12_FULL_66_14]